jgi:transcriptional regulator with XRE-family HTH domain
MLNEREGISEEDGFGEVTDEKPFPESVVDIIDDSHLIDGCIEEIGSIIDFGRFSGSGTASSSLGQAAEVSYVGRFVDGEIILFSRYYDAVVFDESKGIVTEKDAADLVAGDVLVFVKRDDNTKNIVDFIYEDLLTSGKFDADIFWASKKAMYWKKVLREYKKNESLTYSELARRLRRMGSTLSEMTVRQWLAVESHIVGPRSEETLRLIAELTGDTSLLLDTPDYYQACRIVRRKRKEILDLIGMAIADGLAGNKPIKGSELEIVYNNVESLTDMLEIERVISLDKPKDFPINQINKPLADWSDAV